MAERIVVVGHAAVTCLGRDLDATWAGLIAGRSGIKRHASLAPERFLQDLGGMVEDFGPGSQDEDAAVSRLAARSIHLGLHAARAAWADAGMNGHGYDPDRVALVVGSAMGGMDLLDAESIRAAGRKSLAASPYLIPGLIINQTAGQIAQHMKLHGPSLAPANACASGGHAIAMAGMLLRSGEADFALCGGSESAFTPPVVNGFATMKALLGKKAEGRELDDPSQASRPFSVDRAGFVLSEGAGMIALATESAAKALGLTPLAELLGWAMNSDGHHMTMPSAEKVAKCLRTAIERSGLTPNQIDYYNAHGTSTTVNDSLESAAIREVFGPHADRMPVSSIKGALGHGLGAASAIEAAVCVRAIRDRMIPPTANYRADPALTLDFVPGEGRECDIQTAMSASFGFGGTNNALVFGRWRDA